MNYKDIEELIPFLFKIRELHQVYRATPELDGRFENDAEHTWSVAMTVALALPYLEKELNIKIDREKIFIMSLIHDLAEIKTGDTKTWDATARINKEEKERDAMTELFNLLPNEHAEKFKALWEECEKQETLEAKIVKSIDRMDPVIHRTSTKLGWHDVEDGHNTIDALNQRQLPRHNFSKSLTDLFKKIRDIAENDNLFKK
ncbi:MAG: HD domain-containing protein [Patescibacteria group bacterium]